MEPESTFVVVASENIYEHLLFLVNLNTYHSRVHVWHMLSRVDICYFHYTGLHLLVWPLE